ncbi:MAG: prepilin-type N-terminal cleavage/methylation domain-containing protein [Planctomycetota bacterium]|nr:prepilin-type N-terminal cleavage/methylation domain-containing protein [Planctomycetota bacterium]
MRSNHQQRGVSLIEVLIAVVLLSVASMAAIAYVTRGTQHSDWVREQVWARQKALSILSELRAYVQGGEGEMAADLDGFDDGLSYEPSLTITEDAANPGSFVQPDHEVSGNISDRGNWRWYRQITVRPFPGVDTRDLRICTVKMYRHRAGDALPGERMAEVSSVIRTIGDTFPSTQVYDIYLIACENVPGWWVYMDAIRPFVEATITDLEGRNPGLDFRLHWINTLGYGRDEEYAPYSNEERSSTDNTPWAYVYPGTMPAGNSSQRYYVPLDMSGRLNLDGENAPTFVNDMIAAEPFDDDNGNGQRDAGETFTDTDGDGMWDAGNTVPYAFADMQNHCMRYPDAVAKREARVAAGLESPTAPSLRMLLDEMILDPDKYHNALFINLHGELLPMPPVRNYSDAASDPERQPGWRVVTHPERIGPRRVAGNDTLSVAPRFRVHAYKTAFSGTSGTSQLMTQAEPYIDADGSGAWESGEAFEDWNGDGTWSAGVPASIVVPGGDFSARPNDATSPTIVVERLPGGIDADDDGNGDSYEALQTATRYPEAFTDANADNVRQVQEVWFDLNGDGVKGAEDPHAELDGDGTWTAATETLTDQDSDGVFDPARPAESYTDANGNNRWDAAEPYWDRNGNGMWDGPTNPTPPAWVPWNTANYGNKFAEDSYVANYGEPFLDLDGDQRWDAAEAWFDTNLNGVRDGGFERGEMWFEITYDAVNRRTVLLLNGTPLEAPYVGSRGLPSGYRLYDLDYVPCPTPSSAGSSDRFARDLSTTGNNPKNTARWRITLPTPAIRSAFESAAGANDGDAADRIIAIETRLGTNLATGTMWPVRVDPQNVSKSYTYFYADPLSIPFSERYQYNGDPRHCPYEDTDRTGTTAVHGYNWYWDNFSNSDGNYQSRWLAFDGGRMRDRWRGRSEHDMPRFMYWLRTALVKSEALWTTLTGFSYYYMSLGGDVGYDSANGYANSIPMDGKPFGLSGDVYESTITDGIGTSSIRGSRKFVRSNSGSSSGIRSGGYWWSKPWIGELFPDATYASQWRPWGNLRANTGSASGEYRLARRGDITSAQQPAGTSLYNAYSRTAAEGCVSFMNIGSSSSTFHHQFRTGQSGSLVEDGFELAENYNFPLPTSTLISRPFNLAISYDGGTGDEFGYTDAYPRHSAQLVRRYYNHQSSGLIGSGIVRLQEPGADPRGAYIVVNGIDRTTESGSSFIARYSMLSLIHSYFGAGLPSTPNRVRQLPRVEISSPTLITELESPAAIPVEWNLKWARWDGENYTGQYPANFEESEDELAYVLMYSRDNGDTWLNMLDDQPATPGTLPWISGVGPDPAKTLEDLTPNDDETYVWSTPASKFPEGTYVIRIEAYRTTETLHYAQHMEKIYVNR